ncbi:MAG: 6,7-dimethyl-8-ribityllumazine synthase [Polyangiaceae bacterium]
MAVKVVEGTLVVPEGAKFALVASRFNHFIVDRLVDGATDAIARHSGAGADVVIVRVPGAWEIPVVVKRLARAAKEKKSEDSFAIIALAAVIRGSTPHFDYVAAEVTKGVASASLDTGVVATFGVLTTDTIEQAIERAGTKAGNKGWDAAVSAIEMLSLQGALRGAGY